MNFEVRSYVRPKKGMLHITTLFKPSSLLSDPHSFAPMQPSSVLSPSPSATSEPAPAANGASTAEVMFQQILHTLNKSVSDPS